MHSAISTRLFIMQNIRFFTLKYHCFSYKLSSSCFNELKTPFDEIKNIFLRTSCHETV